MFRRPLPLSVHIALLGGFAFFMLFFWNLPALLMGYPFRVPVMLEHVQFLVETGMTPETSARLVPLVLSFIYPFFRTAPDVVWSFVSALPFALGFFPWWLTVRKLFDTKIAWFSTIILGLMPIFWLEAIDLGGYSFALFFLFLGFFFYVTFAQTKRWLALALFAVCFGLTLASKDAFVTFLPWLVLGYIWERREEWKTAILETICVLGIAYAFFALPLYPNALQPDMSFTQRVAVFLPSLGSATPGEGHLYPDPYIYEFHREEYNTVIEQNLEQESSFFALKQNEHYRIIFGVGEYSVFDTVFNGTWLLLNTLPQLFVQEYVGGAFLWIFILPGVAWMYRKHRKLFWHLIGLWLSMEFFIRFFLHFGRTHLNDIGWVFALFAGIGVSIVAQTLQEYAPKKRASFASIMLIALVAFQLVQANRKIFAFEYERSTVPAAHAVAELLETLSEDAVVGHPRIEPLFFYSDHERVTLHPDTIHFLDEQEKLREPLEHYGVTHILGYSSEDATRITRVSPSVIVLPFPEDAQVSTTPFVQYILHLVR